MAEFPPVILGGGAENGVPGAPGLPVHRAGKVSAHQREISATGVVHVGGYQRVRDRPARNGRANRGQGEETGRQTEGSETLVAGIGIRSKRQFSILNSY